MVKDGETIATTSLSLTTFPLERQSNADRKTMVSELLYAFLLMGLFISFLSRLHDLKNKIKSHDSTHCHRVSENIIQNVLSWLEKTCAPNFKAKTQRFSA